MEWKDYERGGEVIGSLAAAGNVRISVTRYNSRWHLEDSDITNNQWLAATDLAQAKQEAASIVRVALEEALAALVGG